jgi:glycosyltransferase involved in cell wall biosynthesis
VNVALDAQLAVGTATGIGEYVRGLAPALAARGVDVRVLQAGGLDPWRFDRRVLWDQLLLPIAASRSRPDLVHCASSTMPFVSLAAPFVVTVHDLAWLRVQRHTRLYARFYFGTLMTRRYRAARSIVTDSDFSRRELIEVAGLDPERISVAHLGVGADFARIVRRPQTARPTILAVGTVERRKALRVVIEALADVADVQLISVGPPTTYEAECRATARALGIPDRVTFMGYVAREQLLELYATATLAVAPSLYEGFGYAAAQALCAGIPLLASDAASHPEIVAGATELVPAGDVDAWAQAIRGALGRFAEHESQAGAARPAAIARFTWDACARETVTAYERALGRSTS